MKRSSQVALVLMGVTATTAAGAYMMPARSAECRPQPAAQQAAPRPPGAAPAAAAQEEPCRRRRSWGTWHWGSGSYSSYDRQRSTSSSRPPGAVSTALSPSRSTNTSGSSSSSRPGTSTSSFKSTSRGGFGSTGSSSGS